MSERRDPAPTARYWLRKYREGVDSRSHLDALFSLKEAFNHMENAAFAEAEKADKLLDRCENVLTALPRHICDPALWPLLDSIEKVVREVKGGA